MQGQILLAATAVILAGCSKEKQLEPAIQAVRAGVVEQIRPDVPERYSASIEPFAEVGLAFKSGGIVEEILQVRGADGRMRNAQAGDKVAKDAELARVRPLDYQQRLDQVEAQRAQSEAQLAQAQAQLAQVRANFNEADIEYARASNLFQSASLVKPQYDQAKGRHDAGAASVVAAEAAVKAAEGGVAHARAAVSEAKLSLSDTSLRAPLAGWISARNVDRGSLVGSSTVGFSMIDTHLVKAVFAVPDSTLAIIRLGQKQVVMLDALQRAATGVITSISPQADPKSRVFAVEVTLENSREDIRPGMIGSLTLGGSRDSRPRLVVPLSAVVRAPTDPNRFAVFGLTERDGKSYASAHIIEIGQTFGNSIEVVRGLTAGQKIISLGGTQVHDGQQVSVLQ
ncbi:MAG TPA: efflux RND transporter periplasmic adaptor subunit [Candidatus Acidoferrum sp.]|nr:efflux RND transporter periplasmic adaptor subunit [Candidatus Acidoferrum sp.]